MTLMNHFGLFFSQDQLTQAVAQREKSHLKPAFDFLENAPANDLFLNTLQALIVPDLQRGENFLARWQNSVTSEPKDGVNAELGELISLLQLFEMLRVEQSLEMAQVSMLMSPLVERVERVSTHVGDDFVQNLRLQLVYFLLGIVLEDETAIQKGIERYQQAIDDDIHPQGYIREAVGLKSKNSFLRNLQSVEALVLMAEAGAQIGLPLWEYSKRGLTLLSATLFPIYYFYTTARWKWDEGLSPEFVQEAFRSYGGYLEIVNQRIVHRDFQTLLADLRPIYVPYGGGFTSLTHGAVLKRK